MRNSSLVEWFCAENLTGLKRIPKLGLDSPEQSLPGLEGAIPAKRVNCPRRIKRKVLFRRVRGRGASYERRSISGSGCGFHTSENAGMSSENYVRIIMAENLRFLGEGSSAQGKSGAKARPKGVVDAHTVDIP